MLVSPEAKAVINHLVVLVKESLEAQFPGVLFAIRYELHLYEDGGMQRFGVRAVVSCDLQYHDEVTVFMREHPEIFGGGD